MSTRHCFTFYVFRYKCTSYATHRNVFNDIRQRAYGCTHRRWNAESCRTYHKTELSYCKSAHDKRVLRSCHARFSCCNHTLSVMRGDTRYTTRKTKKFVSGGLIVRQHSKAVKRKIVANIPENKIISLTIPTIWTSSTKRAKPKPRSDNGTRELVRSMKK